MEEYSLNGAGFAVEGPGGAGVNIVASNANITATSEYDMRVIAQLRKWRCAKKSYRTQGAYQTDKNVGTSGADFVGKQELRQ